MRPHDAATGIMRTVGIRRGSRHDVLYRRFSLTSGYRELG